MTDSNVPDALEDKRAERRARRIGQVKRWAEYVQSNPPEVWVEDYERIERTSEARKTEIHGPRDPK